MGRRPLKCSVKSDWDSLSVSNWCKPTGSCTLLHIKHIFTAYTSHSVTAFSGCGPQRAWRRPPANTEKSHLVTKGATPKTVVWHFFTELSKSPEATCSQSSLIYTEPQICMLICITVYCTSKCFSENPHIILFTQYTPRCSMMHLLSLVKKINIVVIQLWDNNHRILLRLFWGS